MDIAKQSDPLIENSSMEPWQRLRKAVVDLQKLSPKLTLRDIMIVVGYKPVAGHLSEMMNGKANISDKFLNAFEQYCRVSAHWIKTGEGDEFISKPPRIEPYKSSTSKDSSKKPLCADIQIYHRLERLEKQFLYLIQERARDMSAQTGRSYENCLNRIYADLSGL